MAAVLQLYYAPLMLKMYGDWMEVGYISRWCPTERNYQRTLCEEVSAQIGQHIRICSLKHLSEVPVMRSRRRCATGVLLAGLKTFGQGSQIDRVPD